jgi:anaerobic selenocysteine-containing dehydrogenase
MKKGSSGPETKMIPVSCNKDCAAGCPLLAHVKDGNIVKITNNPNGTPYMQGCSKGFQAMQAAFAPDRLLAPLIRTGARGSGDFKAVSWDEALEYAASGLRKIKAKFGSESILFIGGSGACRGALHNTGSLPQRFLNMFGGFTQTYSNYSSAASDFVTPYVFGTLEIGIDAATLKHSELIILWGANIMDTRFGCEYPTRIKEAGKNGVPIIVIDPRKSRTTNLPNAQWLPIRPGTDTAMMAAVLYELLKNNRVDYPYLEKYCLGFDQVIKYILGTDDNQPKTPQWAEQICGTPAGSIQKLADLYGRTKPAALIPGLSIQRNIGGEEAMRMAMVLQAATGNIGKMGGASGGCIWDGLPVPECGAMDTAGRPQNPLIPEYCWPDAILEGKNGGYPVDIYSEGKTSAEWITQFLAESAITDYEHFRQTGIYSGEDQTRIGLSDFIADPEKNPLATPSGKIELASENYAKTGFAAVPTYRGMADEEKYPLRLVTPHSLYRFNSSYSNVQWFKDREPHALWMNPADAKKRGIQEAHKVIVRSPRGKMLISVMITEDIMPGVVCLLQGIWPRLDENGMDHAGATNILTSTEPTEPCKGSRTHSVLVEVDL